MLAGTTYLDVDPILRLVQPQISNLSMQLDETIHYGRLQGTDVVYLATHESTQYLRPFSRVGRRLPAFTTGMGKALLAEQLRVHGEPGLSAHLPATLTPLTPHTVVDRATLWAQPEEAQARGYATDREENVPGTPPSTPRTDGSGRCPPRRTLGPDPDGDPRRLGERQCHRSRGCPPSVGVGGLDISTMFAARCRTSRRRRWRVGL